MLRTISQAAFLAAVALGGTAARTASPRAALYAPNASALRVAGASSAFDDESATEALVAKAHDLTNLTAFGSAPFQFRASLFFNDPSGDSRIPPARGSYIFTWESPEKWREDANLLHLRQTTIADGTALWTRRNAPYPSYSYWWTRHAVGITRGVDYQFDSYTRIEISQVSGRNIVCATNGRARIEQELCLDTVTALPLVEYDGTLNLQYTFADWARWGSRWYPRSIRVFSGTELALRVEIANVSDAPPSAKWITPPPESTRRDWCSNMRPARLSEAIEDAALPDPNAPANTTPIIGAIVYGVIGEDGSWLDLSVLESPDFKAAYQMLDKLRPFRNQPASCGGAPATSEMVFRISPPR